MSKLPTKQDLLEVAKQLIVNKEVAKLMPHKTQTRRVIKDIASVEKSESMCGDIYKTHKGKMFFKHELVERYSKYKKGEIYWIREPVKVTEFNITKINYRYLSDNIEIKDFLYPTKFYGKKWIEKCQGIPNGCTKEMARYFVEITDVRVERLQDISNIGIINEGMPLEYRGVGNCLRNGGSDWWINLWNSTAKEPYRWENDPYVFVYEFEKLEYSTKEQRYTKDIVVEKG